MIQQICKRGVAILLFLFACFAPTTYAQEETRLQIVDVDISAFPDVSITMMTADSRSAPADLTTIALRENGIPVTDLTFDNIPVGIDATFVIDANTGFDEVDDESGLARSEKVRDSLHRFATEYMNPDGLDRISIVVPGDDGQSGRFLVQNETDPMAIKDAISAYEPARLGSTPLNAMLNLALEQAQQRENDSRYETLLIFSDARRLDEQLSYPLLVAQANDASIPIYGAILGQSADENEIAHMERLTQPTQAFQVHMPQAEATDPIYQIWQQQGNPVQISYKSRQRQSGRSQITLNLDTILVSTNFDVALASPEIALKLPNDKVHRVGTAPDTPLDALQPQVQPITVTISWPDGLPRKVIELILLTNNLPHRIPDELLADVEGQFELAWDIRDLDAGTVELVVQALDELGYQGSSPPQSVTVTVDRPLPPTTAPTIEPQEIVPETTPATRLEWQAIASIAVFILLVITGFIWIWRKGANKKKPSFSDQAPSEEVVDPADSSIAPSVATLESISPESGEVLILDGSNITIGRDEHSAQIILQDASISRLHARIRRQDQTFWLFDEGSAEGIYLNYDRMGLAPRELHDGDTIQFGKLVFRFVLRSSADDERRITQ